MIKSSRIEQSGGDLWLGEEPGMIEVRADSNVIGRRALHPSWGSVCKAIRVAEHHVSLTRSEAGFHLRDHLILGAKKPLLTARLEG